MYSLHPLKTVSKNLLYAMNWICTRSTANIDKRKYIIFIHDYNLKFLVILCRNISTIYIRIDMVRLYFSI